MIDTKQALKGAVSGSAHEWLPNDCRFCDDATIQWPHIVTHCKGKSSGEQSCGDCSHCSLTINSYGSLTDLNACCLYNQGF